MLLPQSLGQFASAAALLILKSAAPDAAEAPATHEREVNDIVLVHGARADGSCWSKVVPLPCSCGAKPIHLMGR